MQARQKEVFLSQQPKLWESSTRDKSSQTYQHNWTGGLLFDVVRDRYIHLDQISLIQSKFY